MAEITAQSLYDQLSPMAKRYYDQQFKNQYTPGKENILLSSQPEYNKMKAVYEAEQQVPEKSFLDSINIFGSASAAEPDIGLKLAGDVASKVSNTPGFEIVLNPDGTISNVPVSTSSNLPFDSVGSKLFDEFKSTIPKPNQTSFNPRSIQSIFSTNFPTGITASSAAQDISPIPFGTSVDNIQGFTDKEDFSTSGTEKSGIAKLFEFLQKFSPVSMITKGLGSILDFKDSPRYMPATIGVGGYTADQLNRMNALGGYYSEPMRAYRRNVNRISNLMQRAAEGKNFSQKNLDRLMSQVGMGDVDTRGMIDSIKASADMGYGKGGGGKFDSGRDYSSSPGAIAGDMEYGEE
tara:strand:- start:320 stop:1366 length:1047 start_codon:yes stop_codon:yes gene_type:complete